MLKLIEKINKKEVDLIVVLYKDRLLRFGFELVEYFAELNNVIIEVLDKIDKNQDEELVEDLVQIITVFSCKIQGKRKGNSHLACSLQASPRNKRRSSLPHTFNSSFSAIGL